MLLIDFRFYNALYKKLLDKELIHTSHQAIWLNLLMKAIRKDTNENRKKSFVKRMLQVCNFSNLISNSLYLTKKIECDLILNNCIIFQVCLYFPVHLICGVLVMLSQILKHVENIEENLKFVDELEIKAESEGIDQNLLSNLKKFDDDEDEKYDDVKTEVMTRSIVIFLRLYALSARRAHLKCNFTGRISGSEKRS